ncbi:MAG: GNAT family N-acetyltransferase [Clostridiales bacterium]|nr:GNAT family N-acetyltransferase [Clostridiales bacterium]
MINFEKAMPEDINTIVSISRQVFSKTNIEIPEGSNDYEWFLHRLTSGYLFKITYNGSPIGSFLVFQIGLHNFQLDKLFILEEYQNIGVGKKTLTYLFKRFPEAKVWYADVNPSWNQYVSFLQKNGFFESTYNEKDKTRYIKLTK